MLTHALEFTDNEPCEGATDKASSSNEMFQRLIAERTTFIMERGIYAHSERITSKANLWADMLSRGLVDEVCAAARAAGLNPVRVPVPLQVRSTATARQRDDDAQHTECPLPAWATMGYKGDGHEDAVAVELHTALGNPFIIAHESQRNAVCDAYEHLLRDGPTARLRQIAKRHGVKVNTALTSAYAVARTRALLELVERVQRGERLHLQCSCAPRRGHAEAIAHCVARLSKGVRERAAWSRWLTDSA